MADAGWYKDPNDAAFHRYYDGSAWTDRTCPSRSSLKLPADERRPSLVSDDWRSGHRDEQRAALVEERDDRDALRGIAGALSRAADARADRVTGNHYEVEVHDSELSPEEFETDLNARWAAGWRLDHVVQRFESIVLIWARRT